MLTQIQMIIEVVLSIFLFLGIVYSFYLGRVLSNLKRDRESLLGLVEKLESSVKSADQGVEKLRIAGEVSGRPLSRMVEQAKLAGVELDSVVNKADAAADRLEALVTQLPVQEKRLENLIEKAADLRLEQLREEKTAAQEAEQSEVSAPQGEEPLEKQAGDPADAEQPVAGKAVEEAASGQKDKARPLPKKRMRPAGMVKKPLLLHRVTLAVMLVAPLRLLLVARRHRAMHGCANARICRCWNRLFWAGRESKERALRCTLPLFISCCQVNVFTSKRL
ncbi:DUF6468 domain-containing protein [Acetobacter papayae]|uniref:DUF6468 domain-containing protein n=1 Tax=Acetobacter papayae TaxID=1076592 RepID=UPI000471AB3C|nr:DUF6468 domain-containing protein [Acetobacter papayae]